MKKMIYDWQKKKNRKMLGLEKTLGKEHEEGTEQFMFLIIVSSICSSYFGKCTATLKHFICETTYNGHTRNDNCVIIR